MAVSSRRQYEQVSGAIYKARMNRLHEIVLEYQRYREAPRSNWEITQAAANIDVTEAEESHRQFDKLVDILVEVYSKDNPAFNVRRFKEECGYSYNGSSSNGGGSVT